MRKILPVLLVIILLGACSMPETQIFSLKVPDWKDSPRSKSEMSVAVLVNSPRYLTQPYIASRTSPYQLLISRYAKWDAAPDEMVRQAFSDSLASSGLFRNVRASNVVPGGFYTLKIHLRQFDRIDEGDASFGELAFSATLLSPEGKDLYHGAFTRKVKLENRNFSGLAKALSSALSEGMEEVRTNIEKSLKK
ncbi:MAG TPA: ABC-type transport auxiliary lipoprotein family protein [Thermodesulfovibrionales bacterium]|nr:ABC-type transport auxiliary lipoprotein family protein [Thermodesulfovibrionales bacterium]